jgi:hypothetical protein
VDCKAITSKTDAEWRTTRRRRRKFTNFMPNKHNKILTLYRRVLVRGE